jgi:lambda repressor-like predicted transcriptional regulator
MKTPMQVLIQKVNAAGSINKAAAIIGYSQPYLTNVLSGKWPMTDQLADKLGFDTHETKSWVQRPDDNSPP